jgi:predicted oxidoreductase
VGFLKACLESGLTLFDHADIYGDYSMEAAFGEALAELPELKRQARHVSKCGIQLPGPGRPGLSLKHYDTGTDYIVASAEASLKQLRIERLDLLLIHRPDPLLDPHALAEAFRRLRDSGKVGAFGVSNFNPRQLEAVRGVWAELHTNQVEASPIHRKPFLDGTFDQALLMGFRPMVWSPLGGGKLFSPEGATLMAELERIAPAYGLDPVGLVYAWLLRHPAGLVPVLGTANLVPVLGTAKAERIPEAARALEADLSREDWFRIWSAAGGEVP